MKYLLLAGALALAAPAALANGIAVENVALESQNLSNQTAVINFDLAWENSWRINVGPSNNDGAWVFAKYRVGGGAWQHLSIQTLQAPSGSGLTRTLDPDGDGAMVFRSSVGAGDIDADDFRLTWAYGTDGVADADDVEVRVFAVEMVRVPFNGTVLVGVPGTGGGEAGAFYTLSTADGARVPFNVGSRARANIPVEASTGTATVFYDAAGGGAGDQAGPIPNTFPDSRLEVWSMKYEASQQQWVDFFNTLTPTQKIANDITDAAGKNTDAEVARNAVSWSGSGDATTTLPDLPVSFVSNARALAYLDWAALRPMTEFEFERFCRGALDPAAGEYAWLDNTIASQAYGLAAAGTPSETVTNLGTGGNAAYTATAAANISGPVRVGAFAASVANPTRELTGGSYFGIMELSGNLTERAITVGNAAGRSFQSEEGDGVLTAAGEHDVATWDAAGYGRRGGSYADAAEKLLISDRSEAAVTTGGNAAATIGFRGVQGFAN